MNTLTRPPQTRASGGRTLILLGVLLALAAGTIVVFVVSQYTASPSHSVVIITAKMDLHTGVILTTGATDTSHVSISDAFTTKVVTNSDAPASAYVFSTQDDLNASLNGQVVISPFYVGSILRRPDPRLAPLGQATSGSLNTINPNQLAAGSVITSVQLATPPALVAGDTVDVLATECNLAGARDPSHCETQTTLQNVYIYAVRQDVVYVVLRTQDALALKYLVETGKVDLALRKPGDQSAATTVPVGPAYIVKSFNY